MSDFVARLARRWSATLALLCLLAPLAFALDARAQAGATNDIELFVREGCPRCTSAHLFLEQLRRERPDLRVTVRDVEREPESLVRLRALATQHAVMAPGVPSFRIGDHFITGFMGAETTGAQLRAALDGTAGATAETPADSPGTCEVDSATPCGEETREGPPAGDDPDVVVVPLLGHLSARSLGLPAFTVVVGLLDGFNPCAMWVLLLLLSFLVGMRGRAKVLAVGGTFVAVSGIVYFAFMAAWLNIFLLVGASRYVQLLLGLLAVAAGAVHVKDFFAFKKGVSLSIPEAAKPGLYRRLRSLSQAEHLATAVAGAAVVGVPVNIVELLCTAGLPALYTRVLTLRHLPRWQYYAYLALYNVAYVADDALMLTIAVVTLSRHKLQEREGRWLKLVGGSVMLTLGAVLVLQPAWLAP